MTSGQIRLNGMNAREVMRDRTVAPMERQRARSGEEKTARKDAILDAALRLFGMRPFGRLAMADVASEAGLAKGTVYLYFRTKEELFLTLQERELAAFFDAVDVALAAPGARGPRAVATILAQAITRRPVLVKLLALLHVVLEENVDVAAARAFKWLLRDRVEHTGALLEARVGFGPPRGARALLRVHALVVGLTQMASPSPVVSEVLADPRLALFRIDFDRELLECIEAILTSLAARPTKPGRRNA